MLTWLFKSKHFTNFPLLSFHIIHRCFPYVTCTAPSRLVVLVFSEPNSSLAQIRIRRRYFLGEWDDSRKCVCVRRLIDWLIYQCLVGLTSLNNLLENEDFQSASKWRTIGSYLHEPNSASCIETTHTKLNKPFVYMLDFLILENKRKKWVVFL